MSDVLSEILAFLSTHHVAHLATSGDGGPHGTPLFFALLDGGPELTWVSDPEKLHSRHLPGPSALSVAPSRPSIAHIQGLQCRGVADCPTDQLSLRRAFLLRHPDAAPMVLGSHRFYRFRPHWMRWVDRSPTQDRGGEWSLAAPVASSGS